MRLILKMPFEVSQRTVDHLRRDASIDVPIHQRPYIWKQKTAEGFIDTIMRGLPTHALILYQEVVDGKLKKWIEDGQQRWFTVVKYIEGTDHIKYNKRTYEELSQTEKHTILSYPFTICTLENVSRDERISLFQRLQDGTPLTNGQRFNAASDQPLVKLARRIIDDSRGEAIWGKRKETPGFTVLTNAVAIAAGLNLPCDDHMTTSYLAIGEELCLPINEMLVNERLDKLLDVYSRADRECPIGIIEKKKQWYFGLYTGYILYTMRQPDCDWESDSQMWVDYIVRCRRDPVAYSILEFEMPSSRIWSRQRWNVGLENVRNPARVTSTTSVDSEDEEE
jgi:hypothetical protein